MNAFNDWWRNPGLWVLLLSLVGLVFVVGVGDLYAQTPVVDDGTHTRLDSVNSSLDGVNTHLSQLESGLVTVMEKQATQTALLEDLRGVNAQATPTGGFVQLNEGVQASVGLTQGLAVGVVFLLGVNVAGMVIRFWD